MIWAAVIVAAGRGTRFGRPKQLVEIAGTPMLGWSVRTFDAMLEVGALVVVTEAEFVEMVEQVVRRCARATPVSVVTGGVDRQASVARGVAAVPAPCEGILVHDGARPLVRADDVRRALGMVKPGVAALLAAPIVETVKVARGPGLKVAATLDRRELWAAQTPQCATAVDFRRVHAQADRDPERATDDAMLFERAGLEVVIVPGSPENFKVTVPEDLVRAEVVLAGTDARS